jgi:hypothetical protein
MINGRYAQIRLLDSLLISKDIFDPRYDMDYTSSNFGGLIHFSYFSECQLSQ